LNIVGHISVTNALKLWDQVWDGCSGFIHDLPACKAPHGDNGDPDCGTKLASKGMMSQYVADLQNSRQR